MATRTLREARNRDVFLARAHQILGFPIDVISGREEARLIYQGVAHLLPQSDERRLVVDIGGRSTELILGRNVQPEVMESYRVGSVAWSMRYFPDGQFTTAAFERAEIAAQAVLDEAPALYVRAAGTRCTVRPARLAPWPTSWPPRAIRPARSRAAGWRPPRRAVPRVRVLAGHPARGAA